MPILRVGIEWMKWIQRLEELELMAKWNELFSKKNSNEQKDSE